MKNPTIFALLGVVFLGLTKLRPARVTIALSARWLGLRDKGEVRAWVEDGEKMYRVHALCNTRSRIGVNSDGYKVEYCWRCKQVLRDLVIDDDPKQSDEPRDDALLPDTPQKDGNIIPFPSRSNS